MKNKTEKVIDEFLDLDENEPKKIITSKCDLVEKIDREFIIEDGRQLLRG